MTGQPSDFTTALVHKTYLCLIDQTQARDNDRGHFFAAWARAWLVEELSRTKA